MSDTAYVSVLPDCDLCSARLGIHVPASVNGRIRVEGRTTWANVCEVCWIAWSATRYELGTGMGQRLIVGERPEPTRAAIMAAIEAGDFDEAEDLIGDGDLTEYL